MSDRLPAALLPLALALALAGCGGKEEGAASQYAAAETPSAEEAPASEGRALHDPQKHTARVKGVVRFEGEPPRRRPIDMGSDEFCTSAHPEPILNPIAVVKDGKVANVFVWVKSDTGLRFSPPSGSAMLDQAGCMYVPHVLGVRTGQAIDIRNSDPILHNVHSFSKHRANEFNFGQSSQGQVNQQSFRRSEVMVEVKCDVHGWMGAYVGVVDHPFFAVSGEDGAFSIANLPAGTHTIGAWHEKFGEQETTVTVADGGAAEVEFVFGR